jgi:hypothetical protein
MLEPELDCVVGPPFDGLIDGRAYGETILLVNHIKEAGLGTAERSGL